MRTLLRKSRFPAGGAAWLIAALSLTPAGAHTVNVSSVNVLSGPGTQYAVVTRLTLGTQVMIASTSNGWSNVTSPAKGWVASTYLKDRPHLTLPNAWGAVQSRPAAFQFPPCVNLKGSSVVIRWRTATNTRGTVAYGTTTAYGKIAASSTPAQYHRVQLDGLAAATRYYYRVSIVGTTASMKGTFTTPGLTKIRAVYLVLPGLGIVEAQPAVIGLVRVEGGDRGIDLRLRGRRRHVGFDEFQLRLFFVGQFGPVSLTEHVSRFAALFD